MSLSLTVQMMRHSSRVAQVAICSYKPSQYVLKHIKCFLSAGTFPSHPYGYRQSRNCPVFRGRNSCSYCLCSPCVIALPPDFLHGACGPHPANDEKQYRLYRSFGGLLNTLGVWRDEEYLQRKEQRTVRADKRDIIPKCVITVSNNYIDLAANIILAMFSIYRKLEEGTPVTMGITRIICPLLKLKVL